MQCLRLVMWAGLVAIFGLGLAPLSPAQEDLNFSKTDWPWWRGPSRDGHAAESRVPTHFGVQENVLWKTPVPGRGHSSPVVVDGKVFLASADESRQIQAVMAFELESGKRLWTKQVSQGGLPAENHPKNTEASTTVASDGSRLFVTFFHHKRITLSALDLKGNELWQVVVGPFDPKQFRYGYAPSPLIFENSVVVAAEHDGASSITAFDRRTGKELWRTPRKASISFSSPVVAQVAGRAQLLISGIGQVASYDPSTGKPLWAVSATTAATCGTMVWDGDLVFASGGYPKPETVAVAADGSGRIAWKNNLKCYEQSMIVVDGYLYGLTDKGVLYCWDAGSGQERWRERLAGPVSASPVYAGGNIFWANESGTVYVFQPNPERFELIAENRLGDEAFASPAVAGDKLLLRVATGRQDSRQEYLFCIGE